MAYSNGYAEQCKDWSEQFPARSNCHATCAAAHDRQAAAHPQPASHPWILDHAVHAVRQTALSLCDWTRPWPQILSLGEQSGETTRAHLCAAGEGRAGAAAVGTAANVSHPLGGAVRHRLRVAHAPCRPVARIDVVGQPSPGGMCDRCDCRQSTRGQHVGAGSESWPLARTTTGGPFPCTRR